MKILIISNHAYPAQGPRAFRTTELSEQLVKMGHEVILYTVHGKYDYTQYVKDTGVIRRDINPKFATAANDETKRYNHFDKFMFHFFHRLLMWPQYADYHCISTFNSFRGCPCQKTLSRNFPKDLDLRLRRPVYAQSVYQSTKIHEAF